MPAKGAKKNAQPKSETQKKTRENKAGLNFNVGRIKRQMKEKKLAQRVGAMAPVYMTAVLEYLAAELLELAGNATITAKKQRITPRAVFLAVKEDTELDQLLSDTMISNGGVREHVDPSLMPTKGGKKKESQVQKTSAA